MTKEEFLFGAGVGITERTALGLEERTEAFAWSDNGKPRKEVVVGYSDDALCRGERFAKSVALGGGVFCVTFKERDEERAGAQQGRGQGLPGGVEC